METDFCSSRLLRKLVCSLLLKEAVCSDHVIADVFGRVEVVLLSIFFYVLGKSVRYCV